MDSSIFPAADGASLTFGGIALFVMYHIVKFAAQAGSVWITLLKRKVEGYRSGQHKAVRISASDSTNLKVRPKARTKEDLTSHFFFTTVGSMVSVNIPNIECGCAGRSQLFRDMVTKLCETWEDLAMRMIGFSTDIFQRKDSYVASSKMLAAMSEWQERLRAEWVNMGAPPAAIKVVMDWWIPRQEHLRSSTASMGASDYFETNIQRMAAVLGLHELALKLCVTDIHYSLWTMNGRLDGAVYKGFIVGAVAELARPGSGFIHPPTTAYHNPNHLPHG